MVEPITIGAVGYALSTETSQKLFGPTVEYVGGQMKNLIERCNINLSDIFQKTVKKLGNNIEQKGTIDFRLLNKVIQSGSFCDSDIIKEYYAGILAGARSSNLEDDTGIMFVSILDRLTENQIILHNIIYTSGLSMFISSNAYLESQGLFIPKSLLDTKLKTPYKINQLLEGLGMNSLIEPTMSSYGKAEELKRYNNNINEEGIIICMSSIGEELYMWSLGKKDINYDDFINIPCKSLIEDYKGVINIQENIFVNAYKESFGGTYLEQAEW